MPPRHAAVWLDHAEAHVYHTTQSTFTEVVVTAPKAPGKPPRGASPDDEQRAQQRRRFHDDIARALGDAEGVLVLGPGTAKLELLRYAQRSDPALDARIVGVETVDHPNDRQLITFIQRYFRAGSARGV